MLEQIISYIGTLSPILIYLVLFFFSFLENIFPPSPSDVVVIVGSTLIAQSAIGFIPILILTSISSALGFIIMYYVGEYFGEKHIRKGRFKFITNELLDKADAFFHKYGYNIIIINRFLPGTRAVVSFFCGVHRLKPMRTFIYAGVSSFLWNAILIFLGVQLGKNLDLVDKYLSKYSQVILCLTAFFIVFILIKFWFKKKKANETV